MEHLERFSQWHDVDEAEPGTEYRAIGVERGNKRVPRLRVVFADGVVSVLSYSYLQEIICSNHQNLSLIFTSSVITLEGRNLWALLDHLQSDRARTLHCYSPQRFPIPPGEGDAVILSIRRQSLRDFMAGEIPTRQMARSREGERG